MEGSSTRDSSPLSVLPDKTPERPELTHKIQCTCDHEEKSFLVRSYYNFRHRKQTVSCKRAKEWLQYCHPPRNMEDVYNNLLENPLDTHEFRASCKQIDLDIHRTYPDEIYFLDPEGQSALRRVLVAFSKYDHNLGYVQGMNFIVGALLWHASECDAFWLFVGLMEDYELRDTYLPKLPGLSKHCQIIQLLILELLPRLHMKLAEYRITCEMYAAEWCFSLFGSVVPASEMVNVLDLFFKKGWIFFYRFVLAILQCLEQRLLKAKDTIDALSPLKICQKSQKEWKKFVKLLDDGKGKLNWAKLAQKAEDFDLDENYIRYLHMNFDIETSQFSIKRFATYS
ncbi:unnamed protein product [Blepharisma stoltei]|uniref:Rab-GAP TBC domain-containing protein n=1 Tax=Blepharisma stoltei TaxID=1481888 RepID=A0AAU9JXF5_9CILI|nr:unnamed protein product [Blepharisma stoltei]